MAEEKITLRGIKYIGIYLLFFIIPFFFVLQNEGMTAIIIKTLNFIVWPIPCLSWLINLEFFHRFYLTLLGINILLNFLILLWLGSLVERKTQE